MPRALRLPDVWLLVIALMTLVSQSVSTAYGHERREVGPYRFVVGFLAEPAFEGLKNGVDLRVLHAATEAPVEGLQETLQVEVTHVPSAVGKVLKLRTIYRDPGHYTADLIPTAPGQYRFRFFGSIQDLTVQETFDSKSGGGQFDDIESSGDIQFPVRLPELREIANVVRGVQQGLQEAHNVALQAQQRGATTWTLGLVGLALGALGAVTGVVALIVTYRKR
jgi:hypothetical protein